MIPQTWQRTLYIPLILLAWLAVLVVGGWLLSHIVRTILTLVLSGIVGYALTPLVSLLARRIPRGMAIALAYVLGFVFVLGLGALLVVTAATQIKTLVGNLPQYAHQAQHFEPQAIAILSPFGVTQTSLQATERQAVTYLQSIGTTAAKDSLAIVSSVVSTLIDVILILILSVYLTANGPKIAQRLRRETPGTQRWRTTMVISIVNQVVGGYIRGTLTLAALIGVLVGVGMLILHVPYAVLLGVLAFFMEFIPLLGVLISGSVCILIALFQGWQVALLVLGYFVIIHIIEGDVVGPRIMGQAIGIHPATALIGLVAGTELFGFWGALFAAPLAGLLQAFSTVAWREVRGTPSPLGPVKVQQEAGIVKVRDEQTGVGPLAP